MHADPVRNPPTPIFVSCLWTAFGMAYAQPADHVRAQCPAWHGVESGVDGFVRHLQGRHVRMHPRQYASNLLGRIACFQIVDGLSPECGSRSQVASHAGGPLRHGSCQQWAYVRGRHGSSDEFHPFRLSSRESVDAGRFSPLVIAAGLIPISSCAWVMVCSSRLN